MNRKVLLVEDSVEIHEMVSITTQGLANLDWSPTLDSARTNLSTNSYDLILLDLELPDGNGIDLCLEVINEFPNSPVFILTGSDSLSDKVLGFTAGADDYITKPFNPDELKARIQAKLKKLDYLGDFNRSKDWRELSVDLGSQEVKVLIADGSKKLVDLTALEFKLLAYFIDHEGQALNRDQILDDIWGKDFSIYPRSVDTHVSKLRKKLEGGSETIKSVHGVGYQFMPTPA